VLRRSGYSRGNSFEQNNPIGAPRLVIAKKSPSVQIGRISHDGPDQRLSRCATDVPEGERTERFGTVDFRVFPAQFRVQIDQLRTVLAGESKG
jgi:hypothetical protein